MCAVAGWLVCYTIREWDAFQPIGITVGFLIGVLTVLVDLLLKGFSLRGLSAATFGLAVGVFIAFLIGSSPLFENSRETFEPTYYLVRIGLFLVCAYLGTVIALRGKDEFQLVIPYVRFVPHEVDVPLVVVDTSALIDGRIARICDSQFLSPALIVPQFVIDELQRVADSREPARQARGRRGLDTLNEIRKMPNIDLRVVDSEVSKGTSAEDKLVFLAQSMKAKLLTTDYNLAQRAKFQHVRWLNINTLARALHTELQVGEQISVELIKTGREAGQAVGYLPDGSMVVVDQAASMIGKTIMVEVASILPSAGGKMVFARPLEQK